jgi:hypothetical protein
MCGVSGRVSVPQRRDSREATYEPPDRSLWPLALVRDEGGGTSNIECWQQLHGAVSLRISRPVLPWPPLADTVTDGVGRLLDGARAEQQTEAP